MSFLYIEEVAERGGAPAWARPPSVLMAVCGYGKGLPLYEEREGERLFVIFLQKVVDGSF